VSGYRIFLSSPGDVAAERERAQLVVERLNAEHSGEEMFSLTRWEQSFYLAHDTFQGQIKSPAEHDIVVFIFWKRLGTDLPPAYNRPDGTARTGTEYEFEEARDARERRADNLPDILVYKKTAEINYPDASLALALAQKKALDQFWEKWFRSDTGHFIAGFQYVEDAQDFEQQFERNLREWLQRRHDNRVTWDVEHLGSPYRGLDAIDEAHARLFFGRDIDMERARARLIEAAVGTQTGRRGTPFLLILGASGSGKSSFMRAGLVPRMRVSGSPAFREDGSDGIHTFRSLTVVPRELGENLCHGLAASLYLKDTRAAGTSGLPELAESDFATAEEFSALATSGPTSAAISVVRTLDRIAAQETGEPANQRPRRIGLLLAIDQLEEIFARSTDDRESLLNFLDALLATGRVFVIATMRNDFYDQLRQDSKLSALVDMGRLYDLAPPTLADYRDIIRRPAQAAGLQFEANETRDLAAEIEAEAGGEGALPMVAFLLDQLYRERRGSLLTLATYDKLGGAAGALAQRGDQVFAALPEDVQDAFPRVVRRLVRKSAQDQAPTAAPAPLSLFPSGSPERTLVYALIAARLLSTFRISTGSSAAADQVRWSHEALLTRWPQLRRLVEADLLDLEKLDRLKRSWEVWQNAPASDKAGWLLSDLALLESQNLVARWQSDVDEATRKFVELSAQRERTAKRRRFQIVTATIGVLLVFAVVAGYSGYQAMHERDTALAEKSATDRTLQFMVSLFKQADPNVNQGKSMTVPEVLDLGAGQISKGLEREPRIRADLLTAMGQAYSGLGYFPKAQKLLAEARAAQSGGAIPPESRVQTLLASGTTLYLAGDYTNAGNFLAQAVDISRRELRADDVLRSRSLVGMAEVLIQEGQYSQARQLCNEALAQDRKRGPDQAAVLAGTLDTLGTADFFAGDLSAGEAVMREALALHIQASGRKNADTAQAIHNLAALLYQSGKYTEAVSFYEQALPLYLQIYGPEHPEVAIFLNNMGRSRLTAGDIAGAEPMFHQALAMDEKLKGPVHDDLVPPLNSLALIDGYRGNCSQALAEVRRAESIARLPNRGTLLNEVLLNEADLQLRCGTDGATDKLLAEAHRLMEAQYPIALQPTEAWRYAEWNTVNAELSAQHGDVEGARKMIAGATPLVLKRYGRDGFDTLLVRLREQFIEQLASHRRR
jgi:tetratricopeptide (TPR) repeat protein